ncbi:RNA polymerase sigma factor [Pedobacter gandavensis]|uniref:RNA polymerase sigma-70 factor n=1 Tax=Pedobacter gandavensis TaxID=2679963 RepID=A0ABR6F1H4_9SPHI|nr:RNA polymerase sigma-70 factor [Pedobacter gandavensis]MBB2151077.1 RNA polymerase sigma-70 factor [Pedobacter gandavensis]
MEIKPINVALDDDLALMNAIRNKDKKVFEAFYKKYYRQLFTLAFRYVGQTEAAEEIVHDLFINIWNKAAQLNIQHAMKSYLFRSIVNASLNFLKKEKQDAARQLSYIHLQHGEDPEEDRRNEEELMLRNLEEALDLLPPKCKEVMYLSRFGKLKQQEIADQLNISLKTVKNHLTYGFQKLRAQLQKSGAILMSIFLMIKMMLR